jgi:Flp pilus assembly protein TadB
MNVASLVVAIAAIVISAVGVLYAKVSASSARRSADAADRSAAAAENSLSIELRRRHQERRPKLSGKVDSPEGSYRLTITLMPLAAP